MTKSKFTGHIYHTCKGVLCKKKPLNFRTPVKEKGHECINCYRADIVGSCQQKYEPRLHEPSSNPKIIL